MTGDQVEQEPVSPFADADRVGRAIGLVIATEIGKGMASTQLIAALTTVFLSFIESMPEDRPRSLTRAHLALEHLLADITGTKPEQSRIVKPYDA